jgi:multidrug resistance protein, MATE family
MEQVMEQERELAWANRPLVELLRLAWPITVSMLSYSVMTLVDTLIVGRLGSTALAGVGLGGTAAFASICFSFGLLRSTKVLVSQSVGAGKPEQGQLFSAAGVLLALGLGIITTVLGLALTPLIAKISATAEAGDTAAAYLRVRLYGSAIVLLGVAFREARYGVGDSQRPMRAAVVANLLNIALACVAVFVLHLGVEGAAWATCAAQLVETLLVAAPQVREGLPLRAVQWRQIATVWRMGLALGVQFILEVGSFVVLAGLIAHLSEQEMAAHQIAIQVIHFSFLPAFAIGEAVSVLVGQAIGARREELLRRLFRLGLAAGVAYTGLCTLVIAVGARLIARGFTDDAAVQEIARHLLLIAAIFQMADAVNIMGRCTLRGAGDMRFPAVVGIVSSWLCTPPSMWLLGYQLGWGAAGGWAGLCVQIIVAAAVLWRRVESGSWRAAAEAARREREAAVAGAPALA